jgi:flagellar motor switch/type III secretory pathway protein FliN
MQQLEAAIPPDAHIDAHAGSIEPEAGGTQQRAPERPAAQHLSDIPLPVEILIGRASKRIGTLSDLAVGSVIVSSRSIGADVDLYVNGAHLASGEIVNTDNALGLRIKRFVGEI